MVGSKSPPDHQKYQNCAFEPNFGSIIRLHRRRPSERCSLSEANEEGG